jgi:hypothetical protein
MKESLTLEKVQNLLNESAFIKNKYARKNHLKKIIEMMDAEDRAAQLTQMVGYILLEVSGSHKTREMLDGLTGERQAGEAPTFMEDSTDINIEEIEGDIGYQFHNKSNIVKIVSNDQ